MSRTAKRANPKSSHLWRDPRDLRTPLPKPQFGEPWRAGECGNCRRWFPWAAFYRPPSKGGPRKWCLVCNEARAKQPA